MLAAQLTERHIGQNCAGIVAQYLLEAPSNADHARKRVANKHALLIGLRRRAGVLSAEEDFGRYHVSTLPRPRKERTVENACWMLAQAIDLDLANTRQWFGGQIDAVPYATQSIEPYWYVIRPVHMIPKPGKERPAYKRRSARFSEY